MKLLKWTFDNISDFSFRLLLFPLLISSEILISSCDSKITTTSKSGVCVGKPGTGVTGNCSSNSSDNSPTPQVEPTKYSVICFAQEYSNKCSDQYYKTEEGATIEVFLEKTGGGISENIGYRSTFKVLGKQESITKIASDMLVENGAKAYLIKPLEVLFFDSSKNDFIEVLGHKKSLYAGFGASGGYNFAGKIKFTAGDGFKEETETEPNPNWNFGRGCSPYQRTCTITKVALYEGQTGNPEKPSDTSQQSTHPSAAEFIQTYYQLLNERNYTSSWNKLSTNFQQKSQDYKQWWDKVKNIRVSSVKNISQDENAAIVEAQISYELKDGRVKQDDNKQIHLIWNKTKNEWEIDK